MLLGPEGEREASDLMGLPLTDIVDIAYLSASEATFRFGTIAGSRGLDRDQYQALRPCNERRAPTTKTEN
jgi:hypothetical protein